MREETYCWATSSEEEDVLKLHFWRRNHKDQMTVFDLDSDQALRLANAIVGHYLVEVEDKKRQAEDWDSLVAQASKS